MESKISSINQKNAEMDFEERKPVDMNILMKYSRGSGIKVNNLRYGTKLHHLKKKEKKFKEAEELSARTEILLPETPGLLEATEKSCTSRITQKEIRKAVDITTATKSFSLHLDQMGPYRFRYSHNGRHMVLGGRKGHLASFDWVTKKLYCELNVMESIHDVCFLNTEAMMAVAQKEWTYIYDKQGIELHCLKKMYRVMSLEFLPYHFLLCSGSETGFLSWLDVTVGKEILQFPTRKGTLKVMCQNPSNGVICCGHPNGMVTMWTPNSTEPALSMFCHPQSLRAIAADPKGRYLATTSISQHVRLWDLRNPGKVVSSYLMNQVTDNIAFSQTGLLALSSNNNVEVYKNVGVQEDCEIYMTHAAKCTVTGVKFCPYEDVLGCSLYSGFSSLIVPGSGDPNFDALEANPFQSVAFRREAEVKSLLEKIPYELITIDPLTIGQVDVPTLEEKLELKKRLHFVKVPKVDVQPRFRMKGKSGSAQRFKRKLTVKEDEKRQYLKFIREKKQAMEKAEKEKREEVPTKPQILDRFKAKNKKKKS